MSVSKWAYTPEKCDGDFCPQDCDNCPKRWDDVENDDIEEIDITETPYAAFLESSIKTILAVKPDTMALVAVRKSDGVNLTAYYNAATQDIPTFIGSLLGDFVMDTIEANADEIRNMVMDAGNDGVDDENDDIEKED